MAWRGALGRGMARQGSAGHYPKGVASAAPFPFQRKPLMKPIVVRHGRRLIARVGVTSRGIVFVGGHYA